MTDDGATDGLVLPEGSSLELDMIRDVAMVSNRAHRALGTRLLRAECHHCTDSVAIVHSEVFHPDEPAVIVAVGRGTIAVSDVAPSGAA